MKEFIRIWLDDENKIHLDTHISITDYQVVGLLECFAEIRKKQFAQGATYEKHFEIGNDFDDEIKG